MLTERNTMRHALSCFRTSIHKSLLVTETALVKVQNGILTSIGEHGIIILILLDLSAAFDTIDHDVLESPSLL